MERLLELARARFGRAEVCFWTANTEKLRVENGELHSVQAEARQGFSLRVIRDGRLGMATSMDLLSRENLLSQAEASLAAAVEAPEDFASPADGAAFPPSSSPMDMPVGELAERTMALRDWLRPQVPEASLNIFWRRGTFRRRLLNSNGVDVKEDGGHVGARVGFEYPFGGAVERFWSMPALQEIPRDELLDLIHWFRAGLREVRIPGGRVPVLFPAEILGSLIQRFEIAANAKALADGVSPLIGRVGERMLSEAFTLRNDPHADGWRNWRRGYDDEGVPTRPVPLFERGSFQGFFNDLLHARKTGEGPTGTGFRSIFGSAVAQCQHLTVEPGHSSLAALLQTPGRVVVPWRLLGSHSGNLLNGDFSVGLAPGFLIEDGEVVGRLSDAMLAGNVYDVFSRIRALSRERFLGSGGLFPWILFEEMAFSQKA